MATHVKVIALLHILLGAMGLFAAIVVLMLMGGIAGIVGISSQASDAALAVPIIGGIGGIVFLILILLWLPGFVGGIGLLRLAPWSRVFMIVMSGLDLLSFPFGTALGIYGIWVLTKPETQALFARQPYQPASY